MNIRKPVLGLLLAGICQMPITASAQRYQLSPGGAEVTDAQTGLIWRRCAEGMAWNGQTCTGTALNLVHSSAEALAKREAARDKKAWRLPTFKELQSLQVPGQFGQLIDASVFPATPERWFWSVFIDQPGVVDAFNLYFGSAEVAGYADGRDNLYGAVRLVRNVQRRAAKK